MAGARQLEILPVESGRLLKAFIDFPHRLYRDAPAYVPRLHIQEKQQLSKSNPWFRHSEARFYIARSGAEVLGRIAGFLNRPHLAFSGRKELLFGYFDTVDDPAVAQALFGAVQGFAAEQGCTTLLGPLEFSSNDSCGLLTEGFDRPPAILMPYHAPYMARLLTDAGFEPVQELLAFEVGPDPDPERLAARAERFRIRLAGRGITVRTMDFARFVEEVAALHPIYEAIYSGNWGYMPMTREDFLHMAAGLKQISRPEFVLLAEQRGRPIGYAVAVYDANRVFATFRKGRLLPFNLFKLGRIGRVDRIKVLNLGVVPEFRNLGIEVLMYAGLFEASARLGIRSAEASYVMGSNQAMQRALARLGARRTQRYTIFSRPVAP